MHWFQRSSNIQADAYLYRLLRKCGFVMGDEWVCSPPIDEGAGTESNQRWNLNDRSL